MRFYLGILVFAGSLSFARGQDVAPEELRTDHGAAPVTQVVDEWVYKAGPLLQEGSSEADLVKGAEFLKKAAAAGNPMALFKLGVLYSEGRGVSVDYDEARRCYEQAARLGVALAQHNLGGMYVSARGVKRNYVEGIAWLLLAKKHGVDDGALDLTRDHLRAQHRDALIDAAEARAAELEGVDGDTAPKPAAPRLSPPIAPPFEKPALAPVAPPPPTLHLDPKSLLVTPTP